MNKGILTKREHEVFNLLINNKTTEEIASMLNNKFFCYLFFHLFHVS